MKKIFSLLLTAALVTAFAFGLVACDKNKDTTENFVPTESEFLEIVRQVTGATNFNVVITTNQTVDGTNVKTEKNLTITDNPEEDIKTNVLSGEITVNDGTAENKEVFIIGARTNNRMTNIRHHYAKFTDGTITERDTINYGDKDTGKISDKINESGLGEPASFIDKITNKYGPEGYATEINGIRYLTNNSVTKIVFTLNYSHIVAGVTKTGTATMVLTGAPANYEGSQDMVVSEITIKEEGVHDMTAKYTYGIEPIQVPLNEEWKAMYPME